MDRIMDRIMSPCCGAEVVSNSGKMSCLIINDIDAGCGRQGSEIWGNQPGIYHPFTQVTTP